MGCASKITLMLDGGSAHISSFECAGSGEAAFSTYPGTQFDFGLFVMDPDQVT